MAKNPSEDAQQPQDARENFQSRFAQVDVPATGAYTLAEGDTRTIKVISSEWDPADTDEVWAKLHGSSALPNIPSNPNTASNGYVKLTPNVDGTIWSGALDIPADITCIASNQNNNIADNIAVTVVGSFLNSTATQWTETRPFKYICRYYSQYVQAHACPWFAFRANGTGPKGEDIATHRPIRVPFPDNATSINIKAFGWWRKEPITASGDNGGGPPSGIPGTIDHEVDATYQSESAGGGYPTILGPDEGKLLRVTLVGVLEKLAPTPGKIVAIGSNKDLTPDQISSLAIHLGLWDGSQWNQAADEFSVSNSGQVLTVFDWST